MTDENKKGAVKIAPSHPNALRCVKVCGAHKYYQFQRLALRFECTGINSLYKQYDRLRFLYFADKLEFIDIRPYNRVV